MSNLSSEDDNIPSSIIIRWHRWLLPSVPWVEELQSFYSVVISMLVREWKWWLETILVLLGRWARCFIVSDCFKHPISLGVNEWHFDINSFGIHKIQIIGELAAKLILFDHVRNYCRKESAECGTIEIEHWLVHLLFLVQLFLWGWRILLNHFFRQRDSFCLFTHIWISSRPHHSLHYSTVGIQIGRKTHHCQGTIFTIFIWI